MSEVISILIVEDEPVIAMEIEAHVLGLGYMVTKKVKNAKAALSSINAVRPDLILLDIDLDDITDGVDLADRINTDHGIPFVFVTSFSDQKTLERVKHTKPAGFIVKPFDKHDLRVNIELALFRHANQLGVEQIRKAVPEVDEEFVIADSFFIKDKGRLSKVAIKELLYAEAYDNYMKLFTKNARYTTRSTMKEMADRLGPAGFLRVHRSYMVNVARVTALEDGYCFIDNASVPVSRNYRDELMSRIKVL